MNKKAPRRNPLSARTLYPKIQKALRTNGVPMVLQSSEINAWARYLTRKLSA